MKHIEEFLMHGARHAKKRPDITWSKVALIALSVTISLMGLAILLLTLFRPEIMLPTAGRTGAITLVIGLLSPWFLKLMFEE